MRKVNCLALALVLGLVLVADTGCMKCGENLARQATEKALEGAVEKATGGKANIDVGGDVDISGLPEFLRYPGAKAVGRWSLSTGEGAATVYNLETADSRQAVVDWYKSSLTATGWKQSAIMETGDEVSLMHVSADEKQFANVLIDTEDNKTTVAVTYTTKQ